MTKPLASLSLDLDNKWSYMKTHGDKGWEKYPSYLDTVVPRILDVLASVDLKITFFVVGQDAARPENQEAIRSLSDAGHEIGNHSYNHEPWLHLYDRKQLESELAKTEEVLGKVTGQIPIGFRGPGYSSSPTLLDCLASRNYLFDASKLPTFIGPMARAYYFFRSKLGQEQRQERNKLFGTLSEGFSTLKPHYCEWKSPLREQGSRQLLEIPVTTLPFFRMPFHLSYLLYLMQFSQRIAWSYWKLAKSLCRISGVEPSILLHPLDFMDESDEPLLNFFPGMRTPSEEKCSFVREVLQDMKTTFQVMPMNRYANDLRQRHGLRIKTIDFEKETTKSTFAADGSSFPNPKTTLATMVSTQKENRIYQDSDECNVGDTLEESCALD